MHPRAFLRRFDHAAIFLMIAGTYTPFTTCRLHGGWAIGLTAAIWTGAITGAAVKLIRPRGLKRGSIVAYLVLGWMILVGVRPMLGSVDALTALLIGVGGLLCSIGVGFHLWRALPFHTQYGTASCWSHQLLLRSYSEWRGLGTTMRSGGIYRCLFKASVAGEAKA
jgi:channel protein (hemolysin III family)